MRRFLSTDVGPHFLDSLEFFLGQTNDVIKNERAWPWVILSVASLAQATFVLCLDERETVGVSCLDTKSQTKVWASLNSEEPSDYGRVKMKNPRDLFKSVRKLAEIDFTSEEIAAFNDIVRIRNEFAHFTPKNYTLVLDGVPTTVRLCVSLIVSILGVKGMYANNRIDAISRDIAISKLKNVTLQLDEIENIYRQ